ncbi:MAG: F0F1 ATP synthase subunit B [Nitrococcus sp.]|nr:F0F1 ATP synthase subunit B [Nitrococcus sp.]
MVAITGTLIVQIAVFLALIWVLRRWLWGPLLGVMDERKKRIADGLAAAERGEHHLELADKRAREALREAKEQASEIIASAQRRADEIIDAAKVDAHTEGERIIVSARSEIEQQINLAREDLRRQVVALAIQGAERVLRREVDAAANEDVLEQLATQL